MKEALGFLGLLNRGGKTVVGEAIPKAMREGNALILATDISPDIGKKLSDKAARHGVFILTGIDMVTLGEALGFQKLSAVLIADRKASKALLKKWDGKKGD